ncbi:MULTISPECIES: fatty acid desaturase family protein [Hymenobacter]|uniref:Fatty acid desaturase n=1 Tax=Hymenobacter jejuensis TaxID=2502781 RepID=A0A5B8A2N6_9BACT|nr:MULTISPECIES: fatty acid desaturase [Hymenobacter]MBC6990688.1 fatty acid desaturase [Hymenobacter sp. BT491]QDA60905.1 fatty acid desaturase [Hymenobacter jejuensis]
MNPNTAAAYLQLTPRQRVVELARPWVLVALYIGTAVAGAWWLAVPLAVAVCLAAFVQMHDAMHNALGLSKKNNERVLTLSALLILKSGQAMQVTHLRHHGRCLTDDDPEGAPATWSFARVLWQGPYHILMLRRESLRIAPKTRNRQLLETAATVFILAVFVGLYYYLDSAIGLVYWAVAFLMSATMPIWASYVPHHVASRNPAARVAAAMAQIWTPVVSSFAFHHVHHHYPRVPTALLHRAAAELPPPPEEHHH